MTTPPPPRDELLRNLTERADAMERRHVRPEAVGASEGAAVNQAYRIIAELFGGVLVGLALGFGVDRVFKIGPFGLIGGVLLGFAVSVWMAKNTADRLTAQAKRENGGAPAPSVPFDDDEDS